MCINTCVPGCPRELLILSKDYMVAGSPVPSAFGQPKINQVEFVLVFLETHAVVIGFYVAMQESEVMDEFYYVEHL